MGCTCSIHSIIGDNDEDDISVVTSCKQLTDYRCDFIKIAYTYVYTYSRRRHTTAQWTVLAAAAAAATSVKMFSSLSGSSPTLSRWCCERDLTITGLYVDDEDSRCRWFADVRSAVNYRRLRDDLLATSAYIVYISSSRFMTVLTPIINHFLIGN